MLHSLRFTLLKNQKCSIFCTRAEETLCIIAHLLWDCYNMLTIHLQHFPRSSFAMKMEQNRWASQLEELGHVPTGSSQLAAYVGCSMREHFQRSSTRHFRRQASCQNTTNLRVFPRTVADGADGLLALSRFGWFRFGLNNSYALILADAAKIIWHSLWFSLWRMKNAVVWYL